MLSVTRMELGLVLTALRARADLIEKIAGDDPVIKQHAQSYRDLADRLEREEKEHG
jgi:hypothetical protein